MLGGARRRAVLGLGSAGAVVLALGSGLPSASAEPRTIVVTLVGGVKITLNVDVPPGTPLSSIPLPPLATPIVSIEEVGGAPAPPVVVEPAVPAPDAGGPVDAAPPAGATKQRSKAESARKAAESRGKRARDKSGREITGVRVRVPAAQAKRGERATQQADGVPTPSNPTFSVALDEPIMRIGVPNFFIERFRIPPFLLPIYQAAGVEYGVRWEVLAAINEIETDYGRNLNVSTAGALGWMQFLPATWRAYGVDANGDGKKDPYNPVDAIFGAANYLKASGAGGDLRKAVFAYNRANWYVDSVLMRAKLIAGLPADLVGSLTGLTQGRFPVAATTKYARSGATAKLFANEGSAVIAVADGRVVRIGRSKRLGRFVVLRDVFGNSYTYGKLGQVARSFKGAPRDVVLATAGVKERVYADPTSERAKRERALIPTRKLEVGSLVKSGTTLGTVGDRSKVTAAHLAFEIRPAGQGAPRIDPKPILDGWELLETTAVFSKKGENPLIDAKGPSIGQILLLSKAALQRRVLSNPRIEIYECGRQDVKAGVIDRRVLATLEFLAASGLEPTVTSLRCGRSSIYTASGNLSAHPVGSAVDIAKINGVPIIGNQGEGSITDVAVRRLLTLQGTMKPSQIITLMTYQGTDNTIALPDHADHIHLGFQPLYGTGGKQRYEQVLKPSQWIKLIDRLGQIDNPEVNATVSKDAITVPLPKVTKASKAHRGE